MKRLASYLIYTLLLGAIICACSNDLDIRQDYGFEVTHLPVPKKISRGQVVEIRFQIISEGDYKENEYKLRCFQTDGKGELKSADGTEFLPNDYYTLPNKSFSLFDTSKSEDYQIIDVYFFDSFNNMQVLSFKFNNETEGGTMTVVSYIVGWVRRVYGHWRVKNDVELWGEEMK